MGWAFKTLDGAGTFHGMGIIGAATPGTKHRKAIRREVTETLKTVSCTMGKLFIRYFDVSVVDLPLAYEAVLQNFTAEDKSKILYIPWKVSWPLSRLVSDDAECVRRDISWSEYFPFLPMIDMDTANINCIISKLVSGTTLWSHTSFHIWPALWGKATEVVDNEPPDCVPRSIILKGWGISHSNELSWLHGTTSGRIGPSTIAGSSLCSEFCHTHADWQGHRQSISRTFSCRCYL